MPLVQPGGGCQMDLRGQPELRFAIRVGNVHVNARFLAGEEEKAKLTFTKYGWCHALTLHHAAGVASRRGCRSVEADPFRILGIKWLARRTVADLRRKYWLREQVGSVVRRLP